MICLRSNSFTLFSSLFILFSINLNLASIDVSFWTGFFVNLSLLSYHLLIRNHPITKCSYTQETWRDAKLLSLNNVLCCSARNEGLYSTISIAHYLFCYINCVEYSIRFSFHRSLSFLECSLLLSTSGTWDPASAHYGTAARSINPGHI